MNYQMFCYQCQETQKNIACTTVGVCGKKPELSAMLDVLVYVTKGISEVTTKLRTQNKVIPKEINHYITWNLFITITNANFDEEAVLERIFQTLKYKKQLIKLLDLPNSLSEHAMWSAIFEAELVEKAKEVGY